MKLIIDPARLAPRRPKPKPRRPQFRVLPDPVAGASRSCSPADALAAIDVLTPGTAKKRGYTELTYPYFEEEEWMLERAAFDAIRAGRRIAYTAPGLAEWPRTLVQMPAQS
jgi:hypothetical protein